MTGKGAEYEVTSAGGRKCLVTAKDGAQAKRTACKRWNLTPGDTWTGIAAMKARKILRTGAE